MKTQNLNVKRFPVEADVLRSTGRRVQLRLPPRQRRHLRVEDGTSIA